MSRIGSLLLSLLVASPAWAGGVLVRLDADRTLEGGVTVELLAEDGTLERIGLVDDGKQPDVTANDGRWAGAVHLPHAKAEVTLVVGGTRIEGGPVEWSSPDAARDLDLSLRNGKLTVRAREANVHGAGTQPAPAAVPLPEGAATPADTHEGLLLVGAGSALLLSLGVLVVRRRNPVRERGPIRGLVRVPAGGYAGPDSPTMGDGLTYWRLPAVDAQAAMRAVVHQLSRHHSVLVVADPSQRAGLAAGGSTYFAPPDRARRIGDWVEALAADNRQAAVVVFVGLERNNDEWAELDDELPIGAGGIVFVDATSSLSLVGYEMFTESTGWSVMSSTSGQRFVVPSSPPHPAVAP